MRFMIIYVMIGYGVATSSLTSTVINREDREPRLIGQVVIGAIWPVIISKAIADALAQSKSWSQ